MSSPDEKAVVILEKQWPIARVHGWGRSFWFDGVVEILALGKNDCHFGTEGALLSAGNGTRVLTSLWVAGVVEHEVHFLLELDCRELALNFCAGTLAPFCSITKDILCAKVVLFIYSYAIQVVPS